MCPFVSIFALPLTLPPALWHISQLITSIGDNAWEMRMSSRVRGGSKVFEWKKTFFSTAQLVNHPSLPNIWDTSSSWVPNSDNFLGNGQHIHTLEATARSAPMGWGILYLDNMNLHKEFPIIIESGRGTLSSCLTISSSFGASSSSYTCPEKMERKI